MNISLLQLKSVLVLALLSFAFVADAQPPSYEHHQIAVNETLLITDLPPGIPNLPALGHPDHGSLSIQVINNEEQLVYTPNLNYVGVDSFYIQMYNPPGQNTFLGYEVKVSESVVVTKRDFASTIVGTSTTVYPLDNDSTTIGNLTLLEVAPIFNHGTVLIVNDAFTFTPNQGYKGITHMSYIACNSEGECAKGNISILVHEYGLPSSGSDDVLTPKGQAIPVLLPYPDFSINQLPSNGTLELLEDFAFLYTPNVGFSGSDNFSFILNNGNETSTYSVTAEVMDIPESNNFAMDDYFYTPINYFGGIDVLGNDNGNLLGWSLQIVTPPVNGYAWLIGNGEIKYTPYNNFEGVDKFTYKIANALGVYETATVYVTVSNFAPGAPSFDLNTYDDTPLHFKYQPPFVDWSYKLKVNTPPSIGSLTAQDDFVHYVPQPGYVGTVSFTIEYCLTTTSGETCYPFDINVAIEANPSSTPGCVSTGTEECVWAGDLNSDGLVDGKDILHLCAIGEVGNPRAGASTDWIGQHAQSWNNSVNGVTKNVKHVDADGDSLITNTDRNVVDLNYGKRNRISPQILPTQQNLLEFITLNNSPQPGDTIAIQVKMGSPANPAIDFSGVTFQMFYNPSIIEKAWVEFDEHSWLGYDAPVLGYSKIPFDGILDVAFTRADETTKSGFGEIGTVKIVIDDVTGLRLDENEFTPIQFSSSYALNRNGHLTRLNDDEVKIRVNLSDFDEELRKNVLNIYPNPTSERITVSTDYHNPMEQMVIYNMVGQVVHVYNLDTNELELDVSHLESGIY
ncbi:MAG: Ig-like domain-containing protein, partial [Bacteroidota bacterium]